MAVETSLHFWKKLPHELTEEEGRRLPTAAALLSVKAHEDFERDKALAGLRTTSTLQSIFGGGDNRQAVNGNGRRNPEPIRTVKDSRREHMEFPQG